VSVDPLSLSMSRLRIGIGHDTHRLAEHGPLVLGGCLIPFDRHLVGHSDADALLHAVTDGLLGAASLGDIGDRFPDTDPANAGRDSADILEEAYERVREAGYALVNIDCILFAQRPKLGVYKRRMEERIAELLSVEPARINVKAKTGEGVGPIGREEAIVAECVVLLEWIGPGELDGTSEATAPRGASDPGTG